MEEQELDLARLRTGTQSLMSARMPTGNQSPGLQNRSGFRQDLVAKTSRWAVAKTGSWAAVKTRSLAEVMMSRPGS